MGNYLKGNTPGAIYKQLLSIGQAADQAGLTASLKPVWTDDGGSSANLAPFQLSTAALSMNTTKKLEFRDTGLYLHSSTDGQLDIVADVEVQIGTGAFDVNAAGAVTVDATGGSGTITLTSAGATTLASATTVSGALTCSSTTALNGITTLGSGIALRFADSGEYISGNGTNLTVGAGADINLTATADVNLPGSVGLTFGADTEKIEGTGSNVLALVAAGALNVTGGAASTWKTSAGAITIDSEAAAVTVDGHVGVNIAGTNGSEVDVTTTGALDLNSGAFTLDASTMSIDGTDDSNITVTGSGKDITVSAAGGGAQTAIFSSAGTGADAVQITASAGGIDISGTGGAGDDIDITAVSDDTSIHLQATNNTDADAITLTALVGGIDITAGSGGDIDIASVGKSVNISSTENAANALYFRANGGTAETIKIHADQSTADKAIEIIADAGGIDIQAAKTAYGIKIGDDTSGVPILLGHTTSEVTVGQNLTVTGTLTSGAFAPDAITLSHATDPILTIDNAEHAGGDGAGHCTVIFAGENGSGTEVAQRAKIIVDHPGTGTDEMGEMKFYTNSGSEGTSPGLALTLEADNDAIFAGSASVAATKKIFLDGGSNTYFHEVSADKLDVVVGAYTLLELSENGAASANYMAIQEGNKFYLDGGSDTFIQNSASNQLDFYCNDVAKLKLQTHTQISLSNNDSGTSNTIFGKNAGDAIESGGNYNVCIGEDAGGAVTSGDNNICIGFEAGKVQTTQSNCTFIGYQAGVACAGIDNTGIGTSAGTAITTGTANLFIGKNSGVAHTEGDKNIGIGNNALDANTTASYNIAIGYNALTLANRTADVNGKNIGIGIEAGNTITTGKENTCIGYNADVSAADSVNQTIIGHDVQGIGDNYAVIGDGDTTRVYAADDVGATLYAGSATVQTSDKRIKQNIKDLDFGLEYLNKLRPISFNKKQPADYPKVLKDKLYRNGRKPRVLDESEIKLTRVGFVAQEVEKIEKDMNILSDIVVKDDDTGLMNIAYSNLVAPIIQAIQELSKRVEELEKS